MMFDTGSKCRTGISIRKSLSCVDCLISHHHKLCHSVCTYKHKLFCMLFTPWAVWRTSEFKTLKEIQTAYLHT